MIGQFRCWFAVGAVLVLAACASPVSGAPGPGAGSSAATSSPSAGIAGGGKPPPRYAPAVRSPLDARGIAPCDLLTGPQLLELKLLPATAKPVTSGASLSCTWTSSVDVANPGGLQVRTESTIPVLDNIYIVRDTFAVFESLEISGHPAVHADQSTLTGCTIYTAIADYQGIATFPDLAGHKLANPCAGARRMAEMILSNLPPLH